MPEYFDRYIDLSEDVELSDAFNQSLVQLDKFDSNLLCNIGSLTYAPGKWTIAETFQHLIDWERILTARTLLFARRELSVQASIDEKLLGANMRAEKRSAAELIEELKIVRRSTIAMFAGFDDEALLTKGTNWIHEMSVLAMGFNIIGHQLHHFNIIETKYFPLAER